MNVQLSGLPAVIVQVGFIVVFSAPVWLAAKVVGAERPTLLRAAASLVLGAIGAAAGFAVGGGWGFVLAPLAFLLAFQFILGTSFVGSVGLALVALVGYAAMVHFLGSGIAIPGNGTAPATSQGIST